MKNEIFNEASEHDFNPNIKPETLLSNYLDKLRKLYMNVSFLEGCSEVESDVEKNLVNEFEKLISRLKILLMIHEKYVYGISGFQGSGKSTLLSWFLFNEPELDNWIPMNLGVGENLPVLVTCKPGQKQIEAVKYEVIPPAESQEECIRQNKITNSELVYETLKNPKNSDLLIEILVPVPSHFSDSKDIEFLKDISFLLLPGFEPLHNAMSEEKIYRQKYMREALTACANTILVANPKQIAQGDKEEVLEEIDMIFEGTNAVYVLTHNDIVDHDEAIDYFKQRGISESLIVSTGTPTDQFCDTEMNQWRTSLLRTIASNRIAGHEIRKIQKKNIKETIRDVDKVRRRVEKIKDRIEISNMDEKHKIETYLNNFDNSTAEIKSIFIDRCDDKINKLFNVTQIKLDELWKRRGHSERVGDWLKERIYGPEAISEILEEVNNTWNQQVEKEGGLGCVKLELYHETLDSLGVYQNLVLSAGSDKKIRHSNTEADDVYEQRGSKLETVRKNSIAKTMPYKNRFQLDTKTIRNIQFIAGNDLLDRNDLEPDGDFSRAMKLIPYLLLDSQRLELAMNAEWSSVFSNIDKNNLEKNFKGYFEDSQANVKGFLTGIVALAGVDFIPNQQFDGIGGMLSTLFGGGTSEVAAAEGAAAAGEAAAAGGAVAGETAAAEGAAVAGSSALAYVTGGLVALIVLDCFNRATINQDLRKLTKLQELAKNIRDEMKTRIRKEFDEKFYLVRRMIEDRLENYAFKQTEVGEVLRLEHSLVQVRESGKEIRRALKNEYV